MRRARFARPAWRTLAAASVAAFVGLAAIAVVAGGGDPARETLPALVDLSPAGVRRVVVETDGRLADLTRDDRGWSASTGTPPQSAPLLLSTEDQLFPMLAYRVVQANQDDPQYGLADPEAVVRLETRSGTPVEVRVGAASFSGAGFYARRGNDPGRVYLVPRNTLDLLRSLAIGERKSSADSLEGRAGRIQAEQDEAGREKQTSPYLRQAIEAGGQVPPAP
jgi:hypothetical protein